MDLIGLAEMRADVGGEWADVFLRAGAEAAWVVGEGEGKGAPGFTLDDVVEARGVAGEPDGDEWHAYGQLRDGRWFALRAERSYTGWDDGCSFGSASVSVSERALHRFGMTEAEREMFGINL